MRGPDAAAVITNRTAVYGQPTIDSVEKFADNPNLVRDIANLFGYNPNILPDTRNLLPARR